MAHNPQRPAPRASGLRPIVPRRWDAARPQRWSGWRRALGNWRRPLRALAVRSTFRKAASCWRCRRSWSAGCCGTLPSTFACQLAFTVSPSIFLLLAFMALGRLRSIEALRYYAPGEWGKLLGLDRAPEVRTLRLKLKHL